MTLVDLDQFIERRRQALELRGLVSECRCCGATYTAEQWEQLHYVGVQDDPDGGVELRDCGGEGCRTTLAVEIQAEAAQ